MFYENHTNTLVQFAQNAWPGLGRWVEVDHAELPFIFFMNSLDFLLPFAVIIELQKVTTSRFTGGVPVHVLKDNLAIPLSGLEEGNDGLFYRNQPLG